MYHSTNGVGTLPTTIRALGRARGDVAGAVACHAAVAVPTGLALDPRGGGPRGGRGSSTRRSASRPSASAQSRSILVVAGRMLRVPRQASTNLADLVRLLRFFAEPLDELTRPAAR